MATRYAGRVPFLLIYIREAHPTDGRQAAQNVRQGALLPTARTIEQKGRCFRTMARLKCLVARAFSGSLTPPTSLHGIIRCAYGVFGNITYGAFGLAGVVGLAPPPTVGLRSNHSMTTGTLTRLRPDIRPKSFFGWGGTAAFSYCR
jgi:hypothetical protein